MFGREYVQCNIWGMGGMILGRTVGYTFFHVLEERNISIKAMNLLLKNCVEKCNTL